MQLISNREDQFPDVCLVQQTETKTSLTTAKMRCCLEIFRIKEQLQWTMLPQPTMRMCNSSETMKKLSWSNWCLETKAQIRLQRLIPSKSHQCSGHRRKRTTSHLLSTCRTSRAITNRLGLVWRPNLKYLNLKNMDCFIIISKPGMIVFLIIFNS